MAIAFTAAFNSTSKTLTVTVSDWDSEPKGDLYYSYTTAGITTFTNIATNITAAATISIYFSNGGLLITGAEDDIFPDGVYYIYLVPLGDVPDGTNFDPYVVLCVAHAKCCITSLIAALDDYDCDNCSRDNELLRLILMKLLLDGAEYDATAACASYTEAENKLTYVTDLCDADNDCLEKGCE